MKKRLVMIASTLTILAGTMPVTAYASDSRVLKQGDGYVVLGGQGIDSLKQTLEEIGTYFGNDTVVCPELPELPEPCETPVPEVPEPSETPEPPAPEVSNPSETPVPEVPEQPEPPAPEVPESSETPEPSAPEVPEPSETPVPEIPEQPDSPALEVPDQSEPSEPETPEDEVNPYVTEILNLVNQERAKAGLSELTLDMNITAAANVRAREIKQSFSHTRPNGSSFSTALTEQGVSYRGSGENIAWGQKSPEQVMEGWMNSDDHRANILNQNFKKMGVGYYQDEKGVNYWVQLFTY